MADVKARSKISLHRERRNAAHYLGVFSLLVLSGFVTWFLPAHAVWQQWTYLLHTALGFWSLAVAFFFLWHHINLVQGFRRPGQALTGWLSVLLVIAVAGSGAVIGSIGQYEAQRWIYDLHIVSAFVVVLITFGHLFFHRWRNQRGRSAAGDVGERNSIYADVINKRMLWVLLLGTLISASVIASLSIWYGQRASLYRDVAVFPFNKPYGEGIFSPSLAQTASGTFLDPRRIGRSEKCGACHAQITDEWRSSMHARSAHDPFFQQNVRSLVAKKGIESARYCAGCHMPIALLSGELSEGGSVVRGMHIDEGVSCMGCHGISQAVDLKGVGGYRYAPEQHYLFGDSDGYFETELHNYLMKINPRQHRKDMAREILQDPRNCATCHEQYIDKDLNDWGWVQLQRQYQAWVKGPFSGHSDINYSNDGVYRCQDCHFPLVQATDPSADSDGRVRSHRTPAANTAVPYVLNDQPQLDTVMNFMRDDRLSISIRPEWEHAAASDPSAGTRVKLNVAVASKHIGHNFPAGTIDINQPWIELVVNDGGGKQVYASGLIGDDNHVDAAAVFYYSSLVDKAGKRVWRHDLFNAVGESYGRLIKPGGTEVEVYAFDIPAWTQGPLHVSARLRYRKFNHSYSAWALQDEKIRLPIVDMAQAELSIDLP